MKENHNKWLTRNVMAIGLISLFTDISSKMIQPLLPAFLAGIMGMDCAILALGWIEGTAEGTSSILKFFSGRWADRVKKNLPFVRVGYLMASLFRPLIAIATTPLHVFLLRITDRIGKGIRSSPRDALISQSVPVNMRARAFSFHRAMDYAGAVIGPIIAILLLRYFTEDIRTVFWISAIPAVLSIFVVMFVLKESDKEQPISIGNKPVALVTHTKKGLWKLLVPIGMFYLGNSTNLFILMKAFESDFAQSTLPILWIILHLVKSISAVPGGKLADKYGARKIVVSGWLLHSAIYFLLGNTSSPTIILVLIMIYGLHYSLTEGPEKSLIASAASIDSQGSVFGMYHLVVGIAIFGGNVLFGYLWNSVSSIVAFSVAASFSIIASILMVTINLNSSSEGGTN